MIVEICASNFESALAAQKGGADRIELCSELEVGGRTPPDELLRMVLKEISLPVHVLIRPRDGDFVYSEEELARILDTIDRCKSLNCAGIVCGVLTSEGNIDLVNVKKLREASRGMHFTFHRAFDLCKDPYAGIEQLIDAGVDTILTSGQEFSAEAGLDLLRKLNERSAGRITLMPAAGINDRNAAKFRNAGFSAIHLSAIVKTPQGKTNLMTNVRGISDLQMIRKVVSMVS